MMQTDVELKANPDKIRDHLRVHFDNGVAADYPDGLFEIRCLYPKGAKQQAIGRQFPLSQPGIADAIAWACDMNGKGWNIYFGANPRKAGTNIHAAANAEDVDTAFWCWLDCDRADTAEPIMDWINRSDRLVNTYAVITGNVPHTRVHLYWRLDEACRNLPAWSRTMGHIKTALKGDAVGDPPRIMRLAGCVSWPSEKKIADGYIAELVELRAPRTDEDDPVTLFDLEREFAGAAPKTSDQTTGDGFAFDTGYTDRFMEWITAIRSGENLHNNTRDMVAQAVQRGWRDDAITVLAEELLRGRSDGGTVEQIPGLISSARKTFGVAEPTVEEVLQEERRSGPIAGEWFRDIDASSAVHDFVEELLGTSSLAVVYGESNVGKTFVVLDLALSVAAGKPFLASPTASGFQTEKSGVIYCALEGRAGISQRITAWKMQNPEHSDLPFMAVSTALDLMSNDADTARLISAIDEASDQIAEPVRLIVIDTLSRALAGGNENSSEDMGALVRHLDAIKETTDAAIVVVHHSGKDKAMGARGHSLLRAAVDTEIEVAKAADSIGTITTTKQRELPQQAPIHFQINAHPLGLKTRWGKDLTSCTIARIDESHIPQPAPKPSGKVQQAAFKTLCNMIIDQPSGVSRAEWASAVTDEHYSDGTKRRTDNARRVVDTMIAKGIVIDTGDYLELPEGERR